MNLFETLKQFKAIEPNAAYKETSKRAILATTPRESWTSWRTVTAIFEVGMAVALGAFFIFVATGQFPGASYLAPVTPVQFSVINPATLRAEAQAVDIQIQLAQVNYQEASTTPGTTPQATTPKVAKPFLLLAPIVVPGATTTTPAVQGSAGPTPSSSPATISIDQALEELAQ